MTRRKPKKLKKGKSANTGRLHALAEQAQQKGQPNKAMQYLREAIAQNPQDARAYFFLGNLFNQGKQPKSALVCYNKALKIEPENLAVQLNRANALQALNQLDEAKGAYQHIVSRAPGVAVAHFNLGVVMGKLGDKVGAATEFANAVECQPDLVVAHHQLAKTLTQLGQLQEAVLAYQQVITASPNDVTAHREMGDLLNKIGAPDSAESVYRRALELDPNNSETHYSLASIQQQLGKYDEAIASFQLSLENDPGQIRALAGMGNTLHQMGQVDQAYRQYQAALNIEPAFAHARIGATMSELPIIYTSEEEIQDCRKKYSRALDQLLEYYTAASPEERASAAGAIGFLQPFYLSYQGLPVRDLQMRYGRLLGMLMAARYPRFIAPPQMPSSKEKIRLGVASGFLRNHSSWNIFQGLFEAIDRSRFDLYMFHTRSDRDRETRLLEHLCDGFVQGPMSIAQWARTIRQHKLHVLFFPEFGMDPTSIQLGCLRLAPIQMTSWGHPVSSGLESIDYYLSSDLMEPENGQDDYSEQLVRLPNSSMHYRLPVVNPESLRREDLDIPENAVIYWCCQSLFKYLPRHDDVFPKIAKEVRNAVFVFIGQHGGIVEQKFRARMSSAFEQECLDMNEYCHFLEPLSKPVFAAMTALSDIFLDSIGWSGCNSAMEAIAADRPILTLPGDFMRGRHCRSFLEIMGLDEWIAGDKDEYLSMAIRLGQDKHLRQTLSSQVSERKVKLYRDPEPVRALESLLEEGIESYTADSASKELEASSDISGKKKDKPEGADLGKSREFWDSGIRLQKEGQLNAAAKAFQGSLELSNEAYAASDSTALPRLTQSALEDQREVELEGLKYPAIAPVSEAEYRPFWSVVIPVFNRDKFLLQCLSSVLAQWPGADEMEIIVIDNGSEPKLEALVRSIGKGIVKYHRHAETLPLQANWNSAIRACRGRWVHLLHDDDYVLPGFYQALRGGLANCPDSVGAAFTAYENINEKDEVIFRNRVFGNRRGIAEGWINRIGVSNVLNPPAVVIRREAYERLGGYSEDILYTTDWELYLRLVTFYDWWYEPRILVHYRQHAFNVTTEQNRAGAQGEAFWRAIEMAEQYLPIEYRDSIIPKSRRHYFNWCLQRLRLPLQAGNPLGAMRLLREMLRIDRSDESLADLFDWLGTTFAAPLWPGISEIYYKLPADLRNKSTGQSADLFNWLRFEGESRTRKALADALLQTPEIRLEEQFTHTP